jgi:hypothetical protein
LVVQLRGPEDWGFDAASRRAGLAPFFGETTVLRPNDNGS